MWPVVLSVAKGLGKQRVAGPGAAGPSGAPGGGRAGGGPGAAAPMGSAVPHSSFLSATSFVIPFSAEQSLDVSSEYSLHLVKAALMLNFVIISLTPSKIFLPLLINPFSLSEVFRAVTVASQTELSLPGPV